MSFHVSTKICKAAHERIQRAAGNGRYVNVYQAAQEIQHEHLEENTALEDIVAVLVDFAAGKSLALEFSQPRTEGQICLEFIVQSV